MSELLRELQERAHTARPFPLSREELSGAAGKFFEFLTLPQETKNSLFFIRNPNDPRGSDVGYMRTQGEKDEEYGHYDYKEFFHYHPEFSVQFADAITREPKLKALTDAAHTIFTHAEESVRSVLQELEVTYPGLYASFVDPERPLDRALRFLKYDAQGKGKFLARAHYDRGGCTLALAESAPGLRIGTNDATLTEIVHKDQTAIFMPGFHFPDLTAGEIPAAWHDVIQASEDTVSDDAARWAIVYFVHAYDRKAPTSEQVHAPR
ncbi:hypothetical protein K2Y00_02520 [Patescibacteria group bacterium]|nr:hypothetical protein [Patescibacteria group bacterium]